MKPKGRLRFPLPDGLFLSYVIAKHFELRSELQRDTVLEYLVRWAESLPENKGSTARG